MDKAKKKRRDQLGMNPGTASNRLKKDLMFYMAQKLGWDKCYACGNKIHSSKELSIEHKIPWLDSDDPVKLFFDLDNIAFSHLVCNFSLARKAGRNKDTWTDIKCDGCGETFSRYKRKANKNKNNYCNIDCYNIHSKFGRSKLSTNDKEKIVDMVKQGQSFREIAPSFGVSHVAIYQAYKSIAG